MWAPQTIEKDIMKDQEEAQIQDTDRVAIPLSFLSLFAHELRNPLNAIAAVGSLLAHDPRPDRIPWLSSTIGRQVGELALLIDLLMDAARFESGQLHCYRGTVSLSAVIDEVYAEWSDALERSGIILYREEDQDCPAVMADHTRVRRYVSAILHSALRTLPPGGSLGCWVKKSGDYVQLWFRDTGPGLGEHEVDTLASICGADIFAEAERGFRRIALVLGRAYAEAVGGSSTLRGSGEPPWSGVETLLQFQSM
jgi:signal transduction histidine kinase